MNGLSVLRLNLLRASTQSFSLALECLSGLR